MDKQADFHINTESLLNRQSSTHNALAQQDIVLGNRVPKDFFVTKGSGESDITVHAGSYHLAFRQAGIEMYNIIVYSSILPGIAREVLPAKDLIHGSVMETIMAVAHGTKGERVTAGLVFGWLYDRNTGDKYGGFVCEHNGSYELADIEKKLHASIQELYKHGYSETYELRDIRVLTESFICQKEHGTALVAICFLNYLFPHAH